MKTHGLDKVVGYILAFVFIITLNFFIPRLMPGDPFVYYSSEEAGESVVYQSEQIAKYKAYYGLDQPLFKQYSHYLMRLLKFDLGESIVFKGDVYTIVKSHAVWTFTLVLVSILISSIIGSLIGAISAYNKVHTIDKILYFFFIVIAETPAFIIGLLFLFFFAAYLNLFPLSGAMTHFKDYASGWQYFLDILHHGMLPGLTLSFISISDFYLLSRSSMIDVLKKDYIITAKAKGLSQGRIVFRHALRNAVLPIITRVFLSLGTAVGGAVLIENVFKYPGLGMLMREAIFFRDYPLIQGIFLIIAMMVLLMNFLADIIYKQLNPRLR